MCLKRVINMFSEKIGLAETIVVFSTNLIWENDLTINLADTIFHIKCKMLSMFFVAVSFKQFALTIDMQLLAEE